MRAVSLLLLLAAVLPEVARAQCYLENANAECSVCWFTTYSTPTDKTGVTIMSECPMTIAVEWEVKPPAEMFKGAAYPVKYGIKKSTTDYTPTLAAKKTNTIPHANIHSCIASRGACTPFVANSPGLATHTQELWGDFDAKGVASFTSEVTLTPEVYTIIGHVRFYVPNPRDATLPPTKIDACSGLSRTVLPEITEVSQDSYVMTGAVGAVLLIVIGAVSYASRKGVIDFEKILEIIYSESVTCMFDIVVGLGDVAAFTISVGSLVAVDNSLIQVLPACYLFMSIAWAGSIYNAYHDGLQLYTVYFQHFKHTTFVDGMSLRMATNMIRKARKSKQEFTIAGKNKDAPDIRNHLAQHVRLLCNEREKFDVLLELELSSRELRRKRGDIICVVSESLPITAIQMYIMAAAGQTQFITIMVMFFSSTVFGAKLASLGNYKEARERKEKAEATFKKVFHIFPLERRNTGITFSLPEEQDFAIPIKASRRGSQDSVISSGGYAAVESKRFLVRQYTDGGMLPASGALEMALAGNIQEGNGVEDWDEDDNFVRDFETEEEDSLPGQMPNNLSAGSSSQWQGDNGDDHV